MRWQGPVFQRLAGTFVRYGVSDLDVFVKEAARTNKGGGLPQGR